MCVCVCVCTCFFFVPPDFTKYDLWKDVCGEGEDGVCNQICCCPYGLVFLGSSLVHNNKIKKKKTEEKKNQFNQQLEEGKIEVGRDDDLT